jgi:hypothetical protein
VSEGRVQAAAGEASGATAGESRARRTWRAWDTFAWSLGAAFFAFLAFLGAALALRLRGELTAGQSETLLGLLRYGTYPLVFLALGALTWHFVRFYRGDYARR